MSTPNKVDPILHPQGVVDFRDLHERLGIRWSRPKLKQKIAEEGFPPGFRISERRTVWRVSDVLVWLDKKARERVPLDDL